MATEVAAFLLKEKLQNLKADQTIIHPRLKGRISTAIDNLQQLLSFLKDTAEPDNAEDRESERTNLLYTIYSAEDTIDTYLLRRAQQRLKRLASLWSQKEVSKGLKKFNVEFMDLPFFSSLKKDQPQPQPQPLQSKVPRNVGSATTREGGSTHRWEKISHLLDMESEAVVWKQHMEELVKGLIPLPLEEQEFRVLPVVGSGGSGKTTMVRSLYDRVDIKRHFECRAWVCVSRDFKFRDVLVDLIEQVSITRLSGIDHMGDDILAEMLLKALMEKRYLIVLDDVWKVEDWHQLTISLPDSQNGSRVILTTRSDEVADLADLWGNPLRLHQICDAERWELLKRQVGKHEAELGKFEDVIMEKCHYYSPLDIVLAGGILSTTESREWPRIIAKLPSPGEGRSTSLDIVSLSFHELPPRLKVCFLYLGLFPKPLDVPVRRLSWLWLSEGFLSPTPAERKMKLEPEDLADMCFEILVRRKLIDVTKWKLDGTPKTCRMSGVIRDFFSPKSVRSGLFYIHDNETKLPTICKIRRLVEYMESEKVLDDSIDENLRSFVSFNNKLRGKANREIGTFFKSLVNKKGFSLLKVLDLEGVYKPLLSDIVGNLLLLRFLGLRSTVLDSIPSAVGKLPCLETLDLKHTNVTTLPNSIWKAKKLRHLYMNEVHIDAFFQKLSKGSLSNLQTLRGLYVGNENVVTNSLDRLVNIRKLGLTCHKKSVKAVVDWVLLLPNLHSLKLSSIDEFGKPSKIELMSLEKQTKLCNLYLLGALEKPVNLSRVLPLSLKKLTLSMLELKEDPMPVLSKLPELSILRLFADSYLGSRMTCDGEGFPKLRVLKLWMLSQLRSWTVEEGTMPILQELEIRGCDALRKIDGIKHLQSLKELTLTNMPESFTERIKRGIWREMYIKVNEWMLSRHQANQVRTADEIDEYDSEDDSNSHVEEEGEEEEEEEERYYDEEGDESGEIDEDGQEDGDESCR
ncbi:disease resistance protein RPP13-like isoform X1 [Rhodamnia argentea]|uniref:Disease resistance protein RPP13-like isoform X1 n=1 Tax=Rhodamnia argentea TaxID=178133 RepID=A0A8B8QI93_9MYRT|nr:disease resistance protein RPP13-like isoform X1 [Rhodamnia argentea]